MVYIIMLLIGFAGFLVGWIFGKRKNSTDMILAAKAIAKLNTTIDIYKITHEEEIKYLTQKYTDLKLQFSDIKIEVNKCKDEGILLKEEINKLKNKVKS